MANSAMLTRRTILAAAPLLASVPALAQTRAAPASTPPAGSFPAFVTGVKAEGRRLGIRAATLDRAFQGVQPNQRVIELDRKQPEFTFTWEQYRTRIVSDIRITRGRELFHQNRALLTAVQQRYGVPPGVIMGIWGLESNYGQSSGGFNVIEALATLSWEGRRAAFFRSELFDALKIIDAGDIPVEKMIGSYAGAMGQPQFMPDSFLKFAVDWNGNGKRDLWGELGDVFASVANYLAKSGWSERLNWGQQVRLPQGFDPALAGRDNRRPLEQWANVGVRPATPMPPETMAAVLLPGGAGSEAFLAFHPNFQSIRRYNPSDFYCISVGLIGDAVTA
jgi:membrane-bound lytic murein transglycosylase B